MLQNKHYLLFLQNITATEQPHDAQLVERCNGPEAQTRRRGFGGTFRSRRAYFVAKRT